MMQASPGAGGGSVDSVANRVDTMADPKLAGADPSGSPLIGLSGISKAYGPTQANADLDIAIGHGEIVGLVGANGAGKSTLMRILCGVTRPDQGTVTVAGTPLDLATYSPRVARRRGIRIVHQELSLCTNLSVTENFFLEDPRVLGAGLGWQRQCRQRARDSIARVFPSARIEVSAAVGDLPISQRQMVEIARAASDPDLKLLILDEPTSSLDAERSAELRRYVAQRARQGVAFIFISHKLREVLDVAARVLVMRSGRLVWQGDAAATSIAALVLAMGGEAEGELLEQRRMAAAGTAHREAQSTLVAVSSERLLGARQRVDLKPGEIVGLAGLEGGGQRSLLHLIYQQSQRPVTRSEIECHGQASFVSGDRQREGVFPLWSVLANISIGRVARQRDLATVTRAQEMAGAGRWLEALKLDRERLHSPIVELSGGNQQKAIVARALGAESDIVLLDDPTRGVDVSVKRDFYEVVRQLADAGKLVIWYSTEDIEFLECDRVLVFRDGVVVDELHGAAISEEAVVNSSFIETGQAPQTADVDGSGLRPILQRWLFRLAPFLSTALIVAVLASLNPMVLSGFGIDLLLSPAIPLVLVALGQMFIVGGSQIDLSVGAFAGLINVVSATVLVTQPALGVAALLLALAGYGLLGALVEGRRLPAIVVTLGASFIWFGIGYTVQPTPGGSSPGWLVTVFSWTLGHVPTSILLIAVAAALALVVNRSRVGVVLRGFGNNAQALAHMGWSALWFTVLRYVIAGGFGILAGLSLTAVNTASDVNASSSYTLLSIAAVVIGGCQLVGGVISPVGVTFGAITLSLIGGLLGFLGISTDYNAAVQGALLIAILALRTALQQREELA